MNRKITFLRWLGSLMIGAILLFGTGQLSAQVSLEINPQVLDLGDRPIEAWMEPLTVTLENTSASSLVINYVETDNPDYFGLDLPLLPFTIAAGETAQIGVFVQGTPPEGSLTGQLVISFNNASRDVLVAPITANAYTAITPDVVETAASLPINPSSPASLPMASARENGGYYKNYILPNDLGSGANDYDHVFKLEPTTDVIVNFQTDLGMINFAIYAEDFNGEDGPMATNALVQGLDLIENFELFAGTYYLVVSALDLSEASYSVTAMPSPDAATYVAPADGAVDVINGMDLEWTFGANTMEYQVVLGTTYPPANIVVDWTSSVAEVSSPLEGTWMVANEVGSMGVGPVQGDMGWWSVPAGDLIARACFFDDKYVFNADGTFQNVMDDETYLEPWQGGSFNCGTPIAPHDGSAAATFVYDENAGTVTLNGVGAYMGLPKVYNGGELNNPNDAPASITYLAQLTNGGNTMFLDINVGGGWWRFKMEKAASVPGKYTLANLQPNLQYFWQVNTRNNNGTTLNPEIWGFTTTLSPPTGLSGNAEVYEGEDVILTWESPVNRAFLGYNIFRDGVQLNTAMLTEATFTDAAPAYNMTGYAYNVTAIYDEGESDFSATFNAQVTGEGTLNGNVSDLNTGDDIAGATITMTGVDEFGENQQYSTTTDATGNYTAEVFAGTYDITVAADGYNNAEQTGIAVAYGATATIDFMLFETAYPVAVVTASEFDENILIEWSFDPAAGARALVEFQVWREKTYLPGSFEMIGTTSQFQFVDFDWSLQDWGVYKWYVVAVYDLNQSDPVASNTIDKDMNTAVDVVVALNSAESPAGTLVVFTNVDESPDLAYETTLDDSGVFAWDAFRKGTYDIEVSLEGFETIALAGVDIFDEASFNWLLLETLAEPANLNVTPTGLASWSATAAPEESLLEGTWMVANEPGSLGVGPVQGSTAWWSIGPADLVTRACFFDDKYVFNADGSFQNVMDGVTFLEGWQGGTDNCGTPIAPHDGSNPATFEYDENAGTVTLNGVGAYMGLPKVYNGGELNNPNNAPASITYLADLSEDGNTMILDISIGGGWWRFKMVRQDAASRALETYKIFLDGTLLGEQSETEYQHGGFGETLVDGETYTTGVAAVYTTGQSATTEFTWKYVACDNYEAPEAFVAEQVVGTLNINLNWTNVDAAALDTNSVLRIYRNGENYTELDFSGGAVSSFLDENLAFDTYTYCITYIYDSGAESCTNAVCSEAVTITGGGFVNGTVTAFDGGAAIADAAVTLLNDSFSFTFTTDADGFYEGEVVEGTYNYLVEANTFESQTLEAVAVPFGATITNDFALFVFPYAPIDVVATELTDDVVQIEWNVDSGSPNGFSIYRTTCATGELEFLGFTLDEQFTDNTWGGVEAGVYKWGIVAEYDNNASEVAFSNCLDKDMITQVSVMVSTNSQDSPSGTQVMFTNISEPDLGLVYETTLNATGYFIWEEFRKGIYDISVNKAGFEPVEITGFLIEMPEDFVWVLQELLLPVTDLYVNPNAFATWAGVGGPASPMQGTWQVAQELGSMGVGPAQGDMSWWSVGGIDLEVRSCFWDDRYIFRADGTFDNEFDGLTFLEPWQGVNYECGTPVAPHDGSANATFEFDMEAGTITLNGTGAFLGLPKVYNGGELINPNDAPESITYLYELTDDGNTMIVDINANGAWWRYKMVKTSASMRALQGYKVWLDGILVADTPNNFWQYDLNSLVPGQEYFSEVAAVYTNGFSEKMSYTWTYIPCSDYAGPQVYNVETINDNDVLVSWSDVEPLELIKITQNPGAPANGYFQSYGFGYGVAYDLSAYPDAMVNSLDFHHASWGTTGTWEYNIHIFDWDTKTLIETVGPITTTGNDLWEMGVELGDIATGGVSTVAILMEPLSNSPTDAYPDLSSDNDTNPQGSIYGDLSDPNAIGSSTIGNFLMEMYIYTAYGPVRATPVNFDYVAAPAAQAKVAVNNVPELPVITQNAVNSREDDPFIGANIYRNGMLIAELVQDTFYLDENVNGGEYTYCLRYVYESGAMTCEDAYCLDVAIPCEAPENLAGTYVWNYNEGNPEFGSMITWGSSTPPVAEWLYYDDGTNVDGIGGPATFSWAIKFDPAQLAEYDGASLTKISLYTRTAASNELRIYEGTNAATLLHSQTLSGLGVETWEEVDLTDAVLIDVTKELWIVVYTTDGANYPAGCGPTQNEPNGDLITLDGVLWEHLSDYALPYTWNLRGYVTTAAGVTAALPMDKPEDNYSNDARAELTVSGTGAGENALLESAASREISVYNVYRSLDGEAYDLIATVPFDGGATAYEYFDTEVEAQIGYYYQVTALHTYDDGSECESAPAMAFENPEDDFVYVLVTNTNELGATEARMFPNPATDNVTIEAAGMNRITVINAVGQVVYDAEIDNVRTQFNVASFEAGVYMVRINTENGIATKRLSIVR
jgi:hypothetical protein